MAPPGLTGATGATINHSVIRAEIDRAVAKGYGGKTGDRPVLALRAAPTESLRGELRHHAGNREVTVKVRPCISSLAALEAVRERAEDSWVVIVTDRADDDLGVGVLSHFIDCRVRTIDPWQSAWLEFGAHGVDRSLAHLPSDRAIAEGLIALHHVSSSGSQPSAAWPAAPGGVLTKDHAFSAVARRHLGLSDGPVDGLAVARWTAEPRVVERVAALRRSAGDVLTDATLTWLAERTGSASVVVAAYLREARPAEVLPLGLAAQVLRDVAVAGAASDSAGAVAALARLAASTSMDIRKDEVRDALGALADLVTRDLLASYRDMGLGLVRKAETLLVTVDADNLAAFSSILPAGLRRRKTMFARCLDVPYSFALEDAWADVTRHALARGEWLHDDPELAACHAALRLARWFSLEDEPPGHYLVASARRYLAEDSWVDSALHDAAHGSPDADAAHSLNRLLDLVRGRRGQHDREFADKLALATAAHEGVTGAEALLGEGDPVLPVEHVVRDVLAPLARQQPVLFLVLDGLSARVANELITDLRSRPDGWTEYLLPGRQRRAAGIAALPTLTHVSRTSLLCGAIREGSQQTEQAEHPRLVQSLGLGRAAIFHKKDLDSSQDGYQLATPVSEAIRDTRGTKVVTCILNTVDDALDRSDPGGMQWRAADIKHLLPLLAAADAAGRAVLITADHGHVVERRAGHQLPGVISDGGRVRSCEPPPGVDEVLVDGPRVVDGPKILAVAETLRYGPLKAGYHGGAAPAEVVVPIILLSTGAISGGGYEEAVLQQPVWWDAPVRAVPSATADIETAPALFDEPTGLKPGIGSRVVRSDVYAAQKSIAGRVTLSDVAVATLLDGLAGTPGGRLPTTVVAQLLNVTEGRFSGAFAQVQKLLNVEGYAAVRNDAGSVVLDREILTEQFGV